MFADIFNKLFVKANVGQDAASLGAAAVAAVGSGQWNDFTMIDRLIEQQEIAQPDAHVAEQYRKIQHVYEQTWPHLSHIADLMKQIES